MPVDPNLLPHLQDALGPGYEVIFKSLAAESGPGPAGGTIESFKRRHGKKRHSKSRSKSLGGGRSRRSRFSPKFDYNPRSGKLHYRWSRRSRSRLRGGSVGTVEATESTVAAVSSSEAPVGGQVSAGSRSRWTEYVKAYARRHKVSYKVALSKAAPSWRSAKRRARGFSPH